MAQLVRAFGSHPKGHRFESCWAHSLSPQACEQIRRPAKKPSVFAGLVFWVSPQFCQFRTPAGLSVGLFLCRLVQQLPQRLLARGFAVFLVANAILLWVRAVRSGAHRIPR